MECVQFDCPEARILDIDKVVSLQLDGKVPPKKLIEAIKLGKEATKKVHTKQVEALKKFLDKEKK